MHRVTPPHGENPLKTRLTAAFTLIEMSIVLVIIGLVLGVILMGRDLINAAAVTAQISQIAQYNTAVHNFQLQFNALPGDMNARTASAYGFTPRGQYPGEGDGNGVIEGAYQTGGYGYNYGSAEATGETAMFWVDISSSTAGNLIDGNFNAASPNIAPSSGVPATALNTYFPLAKLGNGDYIYVTSGGWSGGSGGAGSGDGNNYFTLSGISYIASNQFLVGSANIPVAVAYNIDKKIDDGLPQSGSIMAFYINASLYTASVGWAGGNNTRGAANPGGSAGGSPTTTATTGSATTCYDNGGVGGAPQQYSMEISGGSGMNCALSFQFQ